MTIKVEVNECKVKNKLNSLRASTSHFLLVLYVYRASVKVLLGLLNVRKWKLMNDIKSNLLGFLTYIRFSS